MGGHGQDFTPQPQIPESMDLIDFSLDEPSTEVLGSGQNVDNLYLANSVAPGFQEEEMVNRNQLQRLGS